MIPMPYILVNTVLEILSIPFFSLTIAALFSRHPLATKYLPEAISTRAWLSFTVLALLIAVLATATALFLAKSDNTSIFSVSMFSVFFYTGFVNSLVLAYRFLDKRFFLHRPRTQRRLQISILSVIMTITIFIAIEAVVTVLFIIK